MAPESFAWKQEHQTILEQIATTNEVKSDWEEMREMLKFKINENVEKYLIDAQERKSNPPKAVEASSSNTIGPPTPPPVHAMLRGHVVRPFPTRSTSKQLSRDMERPEARSRTDYVVELLDNFDDYPPFTIQRVCELALNPQDHYSSVGKYLRAIERSLFVTSTWDQYALDTYALDNAGPSVVSSTAIETLKHATTPLFSPIPFLHHANSPPPSPFLLDDRPPLPGDGTDENTLPEPTSRPLKVDELDDPAAGQGHMADHPESFSATTTLPTTSGAVRSGAPSPPATLTERFVRSTSPELSSTRTAEGADWEAGQTQTDKGKGKAIEDHEAAVVSNS